MSVRTYNGIPIISGEMIAEAHRRARIERAAAFRQIVIAVFAPIARVVRTVTATSGNVDLPGSAGPGGVGKTTSGRGFI